MSGKTPCPRCGSDMLSPELNVALAGVCPGCLAQELRAAEPLPLPFKLEDANADTGRLGPFRLLRKLGEGGMGSVYLVEDTRSGEMAAVKVLPRRLREADETAVARFKREGEVALRLSHPNLVRALSVGEADGYPYYAMEYHEGESLDRRLKRDGRLPWREALGIAIGVARALQYAHGEGVVHRDVKPSNILIARDGTPKLLDLGISKSTTDPHDSLRTESGVILGTPQYLSPEQARGERDLDGRSDIYSLGATLFHLLTGKVPFAANSLMEIVARHSHAKTPDPRRLHPDVPEPIARTVRKMMAKSPNARFRDGGELLAALEAADRQPGRRRFSVVMAAGAATAVVVWAFTVARPAGVNSDSDSNHSGADLVARWRFDEEAGAEALDSSGHGLHGKRLNDPAASTDTPPACRFANPRSLTLDPLREQVVEVRDAPPLNLDGSFTLAAWVKSAGETGRHQGVIEKFDYTDHARGGYFLRLLKGGELICKVPHSTPNEYLSSPRKISFGQWTHIAATLDAPTGIMKLYIDGELVGGGGGIRPPTPANAALHIGGDYGNNRFNGSIDDVRIYRRALSSEEVRSLVSGGDHPNGEPDLAEPPPPPPSPVPDRGLVGYWKLDEARGTTAFDSSGRGLHGIAFNGPERSSSVPPVTFNNPYSLYFTHGRSQHVSVADSPDLSVTGSFALAAWVRRTADTKAEQGIAEKAVWKGTDWSGGYLLRLTGQGYLLLAVCPSGAPRVQCGTWNGRTIVPGVWTHVAGVYDADRREASVFIDGQLMVTKEGMEPAGACREPFRIGGSGPNQFHGNIDEVRLYNRVLTPADIGALASGREWISHSAAQETKGNENGSPVDLLALIDPRKDAVVGEWSTSDGSLFSPPGTTPPRLAQIEIPYRPPEEYDLRMIVQDVELKSSHSPPSFDIGIVVPGTRFTVVLSTGDRKQNGLMDVDGATIRWYGAETSVFGDGLPKSVLCRVRKNRLSVLVEGRPVLEWAEGYRRLSLRPVWRVPSRGTLFIGAWTPFRVHKIELVPLGAEGERTR